jgi:DNA-binding NtrC family response regulator|tara:strand:+ start:34 stop:456 length:423 start_codon:yes stop_codon:yes gene_type:complete
MPLKAGLLKPNVNSLAMTGVAIINRTTVINNLIRILPTVFICNLGNELLMLKINPETQDEKQQRINEQEYFFNMFEEIWGAHGEILPEDVQYSLCNELETIERERITNALKLASGNQTKAAISLDIGRTALIAKMKKYKL